MYFLRLDPEEKIVQSLLEFIENHDIPSGFFMGVGAVKDATLRYFDQQTKEFVEMEFVEGMEVTALTGNISTMSGEPYIHPHIVLGRRNFSTISGHLKEGTVGPTLEVVLVSGDEAIGRRFEPTIGLNIFSFE